METLEQRIKAALTEALDRMVAADMHAYDPDDRGLAAREPGCGLSLRLSVDDVARIAAKAATGWF